MWVNIPWSVGIRQADFLIATDIASRGLDLPGGQVAFRPDQTIQSYGGRSPRPPPTGADSGHKGVQERVYWGPFSWDSGGGPLSK